MELTLTFHFGQFFNQVHFRIFSASVITAALLLAWYYPPESEPFPISSVVLEDAFLWYFGFVKAALATILRIFNR